MRFVWAFAIVAVLGIIVFLGVGGAGAQSDCLQHIDSDGPISGQWNSDCLSENTPTEPTNPPPGTRYARFYTFTLTASADVTIDITSTTDTYLYLMEGIGTSGTVLRENDDIESSNTNSRIEANLQPNDYIIEATTYATETTGDFTLTVSGLPVAAASTPSPIPTATEPPTPTLTPVLGQDTPTPVPTPTRPPALVHTPTPQPFKSSTVAAGPNHACALDDNGAITCQGLDDVGQVSLHPSGDGFTAISVGAKHSCAIDRNGYIDCWGSNEYGQSSPPNRSGFVALNAGDNYTCTIHANGGMECWGRFEAVSGNTPIPTVVPTPSTDSCRIARPNGYQPFPEILIDFWDKRDYCLIENYRGVSDEVDFAPLGFPGIHTGEHRHGDLYSLDGHQHDGGAHFHDASVRDPYDHSLYKYDTFIATNPSGRPWQVTLDVPVSGLYPGLSIREYNPQTNEWTTVATDLVNSDTNAQIEWTPVTIRTYRVTAVLRRGFTESPFTLTYDLASDGSPLGAQPQIAPSDIAPSQLQSLHNAP